MNYHDNKWIMEKVFEHCEEVKTLIPEQHIVLVALQGSQNYGLDYEGSDIDTKCITTPTFKEITLAHKPLSTTHIRTNDEHIDMKDIRLYIQTFRKQNLNFLEILYTPYYVFPNHDPMNFSKGLYENEWNRLVERREDITHYDPVRSVKSMMGIASEKYFAMEHHYPARMTWIEKYGYDPKQLCHLLRVSEYLDRYLAGEPYGDCLVTKQAEYLLDVKKGYYNLNEARDVAKSAYEDIHKKCDKFIDKHKNDPINLEVDELLDDVAYNIVAKSIKKELA